MEEKTIPVYMFLGFLEAGKTQFINHTFADDRFNAGDKLLLIVCEEGVEEYDMSALKNVTLKTVDDVKDMSRKKFEKWVEESGADCVVIEYNGMWSLNDLLVNFPDSWNIFQVICVVDASTFTAYTANMKSLMAEKLGFCDLVVFNRYENNITTDELHKTVRTFSRRVNIYYEKDDGEMVIDETVDPPPYDINADVIEIKDRDYALWFSDIMENTKMFDGKTVKYKALVAKDPSFPKEIYAIGRYIMNCCVEDMQFCWIGSHYDQKLKPKKEHWAMVTGKISVKHDARNNVDYPMLDVTELVDCEPPETPVATFY